MKKEKAIKKSLGNLKDKVKPASEIKVPDRKIMEFENLALRGDVVSETINATGNHFPKKYEITTPDQISTQTSWISRIADYCLANGVNPDDLVAAYIELSKNKITPEIALKSPKADKSNFAADLRNKKCGL